MYMVGMGKGRERRRGRGKERRTGVGVGKEGETIVTRDCAVHTLGSIGRWSNAKRTFEK